MHPCARTLHVPAAEGWKNYKKHELKQPGTRRLGCLTESKMYPGHKKRAVCNWLCAIASSVYSLFSMRNFVGAYRLFARVTRRFSGMRTSAPANTVCRGTAHSPKALRYLYSIVRLSRFKVSAIRPFQCAAARLGMETVLPQRYRYGRWQEFTNRMERKGVE
jgi:hypothetical protein